MEKIDTFFEDSSDRGMDINSATIDKFKNLVEGNGVDLDEDKLDKWLIEVETILYNKNKFTDAEFEVFKTKIQKEGGLKSNGNFKTQKVTAAKLKNEENKGDADIFTKLNNTAKKSKTHKSTTDEFVEGEEAFRVQLGKEQMLDVNRNSYNHHLPLVGTETNQIKHLNSMSINDLFTKYDPKKIPNYLISNAEQIRNHLKKRINTFKNDYFSQFLEAGEEFINDSDSFSKTEEVKMVGRIVSTEKGFLNTSNVRIELNSNQYYDLVFEDDFSFGNSIIFPNQIVMARGIINERDQLVVSELKTIHQKEIPEENPSTVNDVSKENAQLIMVAAGPFSTIMSIQNSAFESILHVAKTKKVSTLILLGPFLDVKNEILKDGDIQIEGSEYTFQQFQNSLFERAVDVLNGETKIIIVPSTRDILSTDSIPQQPLDIKVAKFAKSIHLQSNPAYFQLDNDLSFYIANTDVSMNTIQNSLLDKKLSFGQQSRLVIKTLFNQNNLYSLYPMRNPLDSSQVQEIVKLPNINDFDVEFDHDLQIFPKIVITPSSLPKFAANINNTIVINPNYVVRDGSQVGTFALITYFRNSSLPVHQKTRVDMYSL